MCSRGVYPLLERRVLILVCYTKLHSIEYGWVLQVETRNQSAFPKRDYKGQIRDTHICSSCKPGAASNIRYTMISAPQATVFPYYNDRAIYPFHSVTKICTAEQQRKTNDFRISKLSETVNEYFLCNFINDILNDAKPQVPLSGNKFFSKKNAE